MKNALLFFHITDHYATLLFIEYLFHSQTIENTNVNFLGICDNEKLRMALKNENWEGLYSTNDIDIACNIIVDKIEEGFKNSTKQIQQ